MRQHGHAFRHAVLFQATTQIHPRSGGNLRAGLGHHNARHANPGKHQITDHNSEGRRSSGRHQSRQTRQMLVRLMQAGGGAIILHAQPKFPAFGIGQAHQRLNQLIVGQAFAVALEFNGQRFSWRQRAGWRGRHDGFFSPANFRVGLAIPAAVIFVYRSNSFSSRSVSFLKRRPM